MRKVKVIRMGRLKRELKEACEKVGGKFTEKHVPGHEARCWVPKRKAREGENVGEIEGALVTLEPGGKPEISIGAGNVRVYIEDIGESEIGTGAIGDGVNIKGDKFEIKSTVRER